MFELFDQKKTKFLSQNKNLSNNPSVILTLTQLKKNRLFFTIII
jgi:hypothetical protein